MRRFDGKRVFITGAGSGFGRRTAEKFAEEGAATVYMVDRLQDRLDLVAEEIRSRGAEPYPMCFDLADPDKCVDSMAEALDHHQQLDILVCNAATWADENVLEMVPPLGRKPHCLFPPGPGRSPFNGQTSLRCDPVQRVDRCPGPFSGIHLLLRHQGWRPRANEVDVRRVGAQRDPC